MSFIGVEATYAHMRMAALDNGQNSTLCNQRYFVKFNPVSGPLEIADQKRELDAYIPEDNRYLIFLRTKLVHSSDYFRTDVDKLDNS